MDALRVESLTVEYVNDGYAVRPLGGLDFAAAPGELTVLLGPSGSGKTTLLSCLGGILTPTSGSIMFGDVDVARLGRRDLDAYRKTKVGFVVQAFNLIASLTARENVAVPLMMAGRSGREAFRRADELLAQVGLTDRAGHRPAKLSGGQQQRVAVARGLGQDPALLLADEPTANLDHIQAEGVIRLLQGLRDEGRMIVVSTHDARLVPIADRIVSMVPDVDDAEGPPHERRFAAGLSIFEQGDRSDVVYMITSGEVDIVRVHADGTEDELNRLPAGQYFGELGALLGFPRSASARARTDVVACAYSPRAFRRLVVRNE